jgi:hypothetical protein
MASANITEITETNMDLNDLTAIPTEEIEKQIEVLAEEISSAAVLGDSRRAAALAGRNDRLKFLLRWRRELDEEKNKQSEKERNAA